MEEAWILLLYLRYIQMIFLTELNLRVAGEALGTVMEKTRDQCLLNILVIAHGKRCCCVHYAQRVFISVLVKLRHHFTSDLSNLMIHSCRPLLCTDDFPGYSH